MTDTEQNSQAPAETPPAEDNSTQHLQDIMSFDPFGPASPAEAGSEQSGTSEEPVKDGGEAEPKQVQQPDPKAAPTPPPAQPQPPTPTQREQELTAQVTALQETISRLQQPPQEQKPDDKGKPQYQLGIPSDLIKALRSEDEQEVSVAMHGLINGLANRIWTDVQEHLTKVVAPQIDQRIQSYTQHGDQVRTVHNEFYGKYPHLKNPMIMPLVQQAALSIATQWNKTGKSVSWTPEFADAIAAEVHKVIPAPVVNTPAPAPKPKQPFTARPGARPAPTNTNEFAEVL